MERLDTSSDPRSVDRPPAPVDARALAGSRRAAMRRRERRIRRSVAAFAATLFCAASLMVYVQLASGHDPALVANARHLAAASASKAAASGSSRTTPTGASTSGGSADASSARK
jgi:hypothetical protein